MTDTIISRKQAKEQNLKYYFTGEPCKHGHIAKRVTKSAICTGCSANSHQVRKQKFIDKYGEEEGMRRMREEIAANARKWREKNAEKNREYMREYHREYRKTDHGKERTRAASNKYNNTHIEESRERSKQYYEKTKTDPEKQELAAARKKRYYEKNRDMLNQKSRDYYAANKERILAKAKEKREANAITRTERKIEKLQKELEDLKNNGK